jgi:hypothetical protein
VNSTTNTTIRKEKQRHRNKKRSSATMDGQQEEVTQYTVSDEETRKQSAPSGKEARQGGNSQLLRDTSEDSGYNSSSTAEDDDVSSENPVEDISDPTTSSFSSDYSDDDDDDEEIDEKIDYLREKQSLLQRAALCFSREAAYNAATAMSDTTRAPVDDSDTIWAEAREYLDSRAALNHEAPLDDTTVSSENERNTTMMPPPPKKPNLAWVKRNRNPRDSRIDVSSVLRTSSKAHEAENVPYAADTDDASSSSTLQIHSYINMFRQGQWMAEALVWATSKGGDSNPANKKRRRCRYSENNTNWRVISDPRTCTLGLVPPCPLTESLPLQEAVRITDEARLVAQSTPPFCVVYVNRAFLLFAGLTSSHSIVGKPIETVLQVTQEIRNQKTYLQSVLCTPNQPDRSCRIRVVPVVHEGGSCKHRTTHASQYMSHIMVPVCAVPVAAQRPVAIAVIEESYGEESPQDGDTVYGTVG